MPCVLGVQDRYGRFSAQVLVFRQGDCTKADFTDLANEPIVDEDEPSYPSVITAGIQGIAPKSKARTEASGIDLATLWQTARGARSKAVSAVFEYATFADGARDGLKPTAFTKRALESS